MTIPTPQRQPEDQAMPRPYDRLRHNLLIATGAVLGVLARFAIGEWSTAHPVLDIPLATLSINLLGCLLIGIVQTLCSELHMLRRELQLFLAVGLLGGFTTFSTFSIETVQLLQAGRVIAALTYQALSLLGGMVAVVGGVAATQRFSRRSKA